MEREGGTVLRYSGCWSRSKGLSSTGILHTLLLLTCCAPVLWELMDGNVVLARTLNCLLLMIPLVYPERKLRFMCDPPQNCVSQPA